MKSLLSNLFSLLFVFLFILMIAVAVQPAWFANNLPEQFDILRVLPVKVDLAQGEQTIFTLINQERVNNGLNPLVWDENLATYSRKHSTDMALSNTVYHDKPELAALNAGENALMMPKSYGGFGLLPYFYFNFYRTSDALWQDSVLSWMDSPGHRANILTTGYTHTGVGIAVASDGVTYYETQNFR